MENIDNCEISKIEKTFSIMQFNTLAKNLCDKKSFPFIKEEFLDWNYRLKLFKTLFNSEKHDLYCFEEVDSIEDFVDILGKDYSYVYYKKDSGAPGGQALFYNNERYKILFEEKVNLPKDESLEKGSQLMLLAVLNDKLNNKNFIVSVVHLKAKQNEEMEKIRKTQMEFILNYYSNDSLLVKIKDYKISGVILLGDFNSQPEEVPKFLLEKKLNLDFVSNFKSAFSFDIKFTSVKSRDKFYNYLIDYIFYSEGLVLKNSYRAFNNEDVDKFKPNGLPNEEFPSDHLYLVAEFNF